MDSKILNELKARSKSLKPCVFIGKNGLNDNIYNEIKKLLLKRKIIKIKFTRGAVDNEDKKELIEKILSKIDCVLIDKVGFTISVYKR